jgi:4-oxalocrotonate tautomerase
VAGAISTVKAPYQPTHSTGALHAILNVKVSAQRTPELSARIAETLLDLTTRVLGKRRDLTAVVITFVDPADWYVAGRSLADLKQSSFYFDVKVVDETNTKAEKARYITEAFAAFEGLLGALHPESYVYVQDVRATAYGLAAARRNTATSTPSNKQAIHQKLPRSTDMTTMTTTNNPLPT